MSLLEISHLTTKFETQQGTVSAVRDVSYHLEEGEVLGIVGESGSGKSVGMLTLMGLLASNGRVEEGEILFDGENISPPHMKDRKEKRAYEKKNAADPRKPHRHDFPGSDDISESDPENRNSDDRGNPKASELLQKRSGSESH